MKVQFFEQGKTSIKSISCGAKHTSMIDKDGNLYVCGIGVFGQLGTNSKNKQILPFRLPNNYGPIYSSSCGTSHTLILTETGEVFSTGGNDFGQLGNGTKKQSFTFVPIKMTCREFIVKISAGNISACITETGKVHIWGTGVFGELLVPTLVEDFVEPIRDICMGGDCGIFVDVNNKVFAWGNNANGELGVGDFEFRKKPIHVK